MRQKMFATPKIAVVRIHLPYRVQLRKPLVRFILGFRRQRLMFDMGTENTYLEAENRSAHA